MPTLRSKQQVANPVGKRLQLMLRPRKLAEQQPRRLRQKLAYHQKMLRLSLGSSVALWPASSVWHKPLLLFARVLTNLCSVFPGKQEKNASEVASLLQGVMGVLPGATPKALLPIHHNFLLAISAALTCGIKPVLRACCCAFPRLLMRALAEVFNDQFDLIVSIVKSSLDVDSGDHNGEKAVVGVLTNILKTPGNLAKLGEDELFVTCLIKRLPLCVRKREVFRQALPLLTSIFGMHFH